MLAIAMLSGHKTPFLFFDNINLRVQYTVEETFTTAT